MQYVVCSNPDLISVAVTCAAYRLQCHRERESLIGLKWNAGEQKLAMWKTWKNRIEMCRECTPLDVFKQRNYKIGANFLHFI